MGRVSYRAFGTERIAFRESTGYTRRILTNRMNHTDVFMIYSHRFPGSVNYDNRLTIVGIDP